jgi:hypothetical protein
MKVGSNVSSIKDLKPGLNVEERIMYVPDTLNLPDNIALAGIVSLGYKLGFSMKIIPYGERSTRSIPQDVWKYAAGVSFASRNGEDSIFLTIKRKKDPYEYGRTFARAQQILGAFNSDKALTIAALKKDNRFFGNNPNETEGDKRTKISVTYLAKTLENIFLEYEWRVELAAMYLKLLRLSWDHLDDEVLNKSILGNITSYSEAVASYKTTTVVTRQGTKNKPSETKVVVPKIPKGSPLFVKLEMECITLLLKPIFSSDIPSKSEEWLGYIKEHKWHNVIAELAGSARTQGEILAKFASCTTKRLQECRKSGLKNDTRKKDVTPSDVISMILKRADPVVAFATELSRIDPTCKHLLKRFWAGDNSVKDGFDFGTSFALLTNFLANQNLYGEKLQNSGPIPDKGKNPEIPKTPKEPGNPVSAAVHKYRNDKKNNSYCQDILYELLLEGKLLYPEDVEKFSRDFEKIEDSKDYKKAKGEKARKDYVFSQKKEWYADLTLGRSLIG